MKKILLTLAILCSFSFNNFAQSITHYVNSGNYYYTPSSLTINEGDTVVWINDGGFHNVNADINTLTGSSFNNPVAFLSSPTSNSTLHTFIFTVPGTYNYDCSVGSHALNGMVGSLIVNALPIPGCTDPLALNYDANATIDDGSCIYPSNSIYDIVANSNDHNTLELAIDTCGLTSTLQGAGTFTLFAPTDAAFNALPQGTIAALLNDLPQLTNILLHHALGDTVMSGMLSNNQIVTTLLGTDVTVTINSNGVFIDNAQVIVADIVADNGVVHVIDAVLLPPAPQSNSIYDIVANSNDHNTLELAIDTCGLTSTLQGPGTFTLFAPTDAAFNALPQGTIAALLNDLPQLTNILLHHALGDTVMSGMLSNNQIVTTLLGTDVTVTINSNGVFIDNAQVIVADIVADNGVVHVIDAVLLPPPPSTNSVYDIVANSTDHNILEFAIDTCGLTTTLKGAGPFTAFAPTDVAFNALGQATILQLIADLPTLTNILKHHVVGDSVVSGMLSNNQIVTTLLGDDVTVTINTNGDVFIDNAQVIVADIVADNGVVHVIDAVLIPTTPANNTVYDIIDLSPSHTTLKTAIDACGLDGTLKGAGPFTVFAPTDAAFNALPAGTIAALLNDLPQLTDILKHHVVGANVLSGSLSNNQIVTTLLGTDVTVTINSNGDLFIDNAQVIVADIVADNGVVHVIDAVLLPASTLVSEINELNNKYLHSVNILGEKISRDVKNQIVLDIYSNGNIIKRFTR